MSYKYIFLLFLIATPLLNAQDTNKIFIKKIIFEQHEIMPDSFFFAGIVNALHISTKEYTLRKNLLFREGDTTKRVFIIESEKNLRDLEFLRDVAIDTLGNSTDSIILKVRAKDKWTTSIGANFNLNGNLHNYGLRFKEQNFIGLGTNISLDFSRTNFGDNKEIIIDEKNLFGSFANLKLQYKDYYNWDIKTLNLNKDFHSVSSYYSFEFYGEIFNGQMQLPEIYSDNGKRVLFSGRAAYGIGEKEKTIIELGFEKKLDNIPNIWFYHEFLLKTGLSFMNVEYSKIKGYNIYSDFQTVETGYLAGFSIEKDVYTKNFKINLSGSGIIKNEGSYYSGKFFYFKGFSPSNFGFAANLVSVFPYKKTALVLRVKSLLLENPQNLETFTINDFRTYQQSDSWCDKKLSFTVEERIFDLLNLYNISFGTTIFADYTAANIINNNKNSFNRFIDFGAGLRIEPYFLGGSQIIRMDLAYNPNDKNFVFCMGVGQYFNAISKINFLNMFSGKE